MHIQPNKLALDPAWLTTSDALGLSCIPKNWTYDENLLLERNIINPVVSSIIHP